MPVPLKYDINDPVHVSFVKCMAILWAYIWNIQPNVNDEYIKKVVKEFLFFVV